jgi:hypothetical protein
VIDLGLAVHRAALCHEMARIGGSHGDCSRRRCPQERGVVCQPGYSCHS